MPLRTLEACIRQLQESITGRLLQAAWPFEASAELTDFVMAWYVRRGYSIERCDGE